jgi:hypothetical protein
MFEGGMNKFALVIISLNETQEPMHAIVGFFEVYETTSLCMAWVHGATITIIVQLWCVLLNIYMF